MRFLQSDNHHLRLSPFRVIAVISGFTVFSRSNNRKLPPQALFTSFSLFSLRLISPLPVREIVLSWYGEIEISLLQTYTYRTVPRFVLKLYDVYLCFAAKNIETFFGCMFCDPGQVQARPSVLLEREETLFRC